MPHACVEESCVPPSPWERCVFGTALLMCFGVDGQFFGLHSFRSGGAAAAALSPRPERLVKVHGRWRSDVPHLHVRAARGAVGNGSCDDLRLRQLHRRRAVPARVADRVASGSCSVPPWKWRPPAISWRAAVHALCSHLCSCSSGLCVLG